MNDIKNKIEPSIYVGTYEKYNNGSIAGKWLKLNDYEDISAFYKACTELHKDLQWNLQKKRVLQNLETGLITVLIGKELQGI